MKLFIKSPIVFTLKILKWSLIFAFVSIIKTFAFQEYSGFLLMLSGCVKSVCISFPAIYSFAFMDTLVFLMKEKNKSPLPIVTLIVPFLLVLLLLQPFLYSYVQTLFVQSPDTIQATSSYSLFFEQFLSLKIFLKQVYLVLDDCRQAYFEGFLYYLFFSFAYVFFLFSLAVFTINARWRMFNLLLVILAFRIFVLLYSVMNAHEAEFYIFSFSTNQFRGIPTLIIIIGTSSLIYLYGIASRYKRVF